MASSWISPNHAKTDHFSMTRQKGQYDIKTRYDGLIILYTCILRYVIPRYCNLLDFGPDMIYPGLITVKKITSGDFPKYWEWLTGGVFDHIVIKNIPSDVWWPRVVRRSYGTYVDLTG